jgi:predicted DsbA family dithiol-disulfide isomerase
VSLANRMALASPQIRAVCIEANEFPRLSNQFRVRGVPHTVINRSAAVVGALPEREFVAAVLEGAGVLADEPPQATTGPTTDIGG